MQNIKNDLRLVEEFCLTENLECYDPYDVWMTATGIWVKELYNTHKILGLLPAAAISIWDQFINNEKRFSYRKREYPTARATAALTLLNIYEHTKRIGYLTFAKMHIDWLLANSCTGYAGMCWGLGFKWAAGDDLDYDENTPFSTHTPYVLEALDRYVALSGDKKFLSQIESVFNFFEEDIKIMYEDKTTMATSYGPDRDRVVTNAVSYSMFAYAIFLKHIPAKKELIEVKIQKLYNFIKGKQREDGSWLYEPDSKDSFIDCFHSCFVLKNIFKTGKIIPLDGSETILKKGYTYVKDNFYNSRTGLFKRFSLSNKPSIVKYDLYDNAEMLHLAILLNDQELVSSLSATIRTTFVKSGIIYSVIDILNIKRNRNTLRWAVMPYLYALSSKGISTQS